MREDINKVIIQWIEKGPDGNPILQTRKYSDLKKADDFIQKLPDRGIETCTKKVSSLVRIKEV